MHIFSLSTDLPSGVRRHFSPLSVDHVPETRSEAASLFPSAFTLLVAILEKLEVKSCASNQEAFQRTDGFMYLLSEEKRRRGELKEEPSGSHGSPDGSKEKYDKATLLTWYNSYMFSKFDLSTPAKAQVHASHASHRWPLLFDDLTGHTQAGDTLLKALFVTPPGPAIKDVIDKLTPWESLGIATITVPSSNQRTLLAVSNTLLAPHAHAHAELLPYVIQQLYLGCVHKKFSLAACCAHYKTALDVIPFIHIPLYLWLATELLVTIQHTTISTGYSRHARDATHTRAPRAHTHSSCVVLVSFAVQRKPSVVSSVRAPPGPLDPRRAASPQRQGTF